MGELPMWGRVARTKEQGLSQTAEDRLRTIAEDKQRYPRWNERMVDAIPKLEQEGRKWFQLYDKIADMKTLEAAWRRIDRRTVGKARSRGAGPDGVTVEDFAAISESELNRLCRKLKDGSYRPAPVRRHHIPKPGKGAKTRPLGLPTIADKVVQEAARGVIEPIWEARFHDFSHGFRPGRSVDTACLEMEAHIESGLEWIVDADIKGCFDNIPHDTVTRLIAERISDGKVIKLVRSMLKAGVMEEMNITHPATGTPQGGVISPLLCNIVLHEFDTAMKQAQIATVRYADDFVLLCRSREEAQDILAAAQETLASLGLQISSEKTRIVHIDEGFDFLGWHYKGHKRWPRDGSVKKHKDALRAKTRRNRPGSIAAIAEELKPLQQGWFNFFRNGNSHGTFTMIESWLRRRLRSILVARIRGRSGISNMLDNIRWPNKHFSDKGLFSYDVHLAIFRSKKSAASP